MRRAETDMIVLQVGRWRRSAVLARIAGLFGLLGRAR